MRALLYDYVRNVAVFLIFMSIAGIIVPEGRFKGYINLALRLILVLLVAQPLITLAGSGFAGTFFDMGMNLDGRAMRGEYVFNDASQNEKILESYKKNLETQLERLIQPYSYSVESCVFTVGENEADFGEIKNVYLALSKGRKTDESRSVIRVEPVRIGSPALPSEEQEAVQDEIKSIKKAISDFYNVTSTNILITVQRTE
ncbi:MAG: stage III sporulation protein AF [Clostridiales bacterium]|jgi:stage III sporulation protein AF|nr:stage III sporulation protein AF [Clostridiales bacterium]